MRYVGLSVSPCSSSPPFLVYASLLHCSSPFYQKSSVKAVEHHRGVQLERKCIMSETKNESTRAIGQRHLPPEPSSITFCSTRLKNRVLTPTAYALTAGYEWTWSSTARTQHWPLCILKKRDSLEIDSEECSTVQWSVLPSVSWPTARTPWS